MFTQHNEGFMFAQHNYKTEALPNTQIYIAQVAPGAHPPFTKLTGSSFTSVYRQEQGEF